MFANPLVRTLASFIESVGIPAVAASSLSQTVFPGLDIQNGCVLIDETRVVYPGDILHEAGHLAVTDSRHRSAPILTPSGGDELSALAWSYAAACHLEIDPAIVFYPASYHDTGDALVEAFAAGRYIGVPMLQLYGMTTSYPRMRRWLR